MPNLPHYSALSGLPFLSSIPLIPLLACFTSLHPSASLHRAWAHPWIEASVTCVENESDGKHSNSSKTCIDDEHGWDEIMLNMSTGKGKEQQATN